MSDFAVREGNVVEVVSDLLLLKYAQAFYGADAAVASRLLSAGLCKESDLRPPPVEFVLIDTEGIIAPKRILLEGTPPLRAFLYDEMEEFAYKAVEKIADLDLPVRDLTTTVHGVGYGLDGGESLQRLVRGFIQGQAKHSLWTITRVTFLTLFEREQRLLQTVLASISPTAQTKRYSKSPERDEISLTESTRSVSQPASRSAPSASGLVPGAKKRQVFVALPFAEEFQNVYEFGIYPAVRNCGFICERVDETHFTGDILERIRAGIEAADLVIADLSESRPNVYLEVGYAWGRGVPVIFVAKKGEKLHFDVSTHRCIYYGKFSQFAKDLEQLIQGLQASREM